MAGYSDQAGALTLGDDDVLRIGDYEVAYDSGQDQWEARYTPTGDVAHVPKNQSGSLFPTDFADALAGQALADDGNLYGSVQDAENAASDWVFVGPGTFNESVGIDTAGLTMVGSGYDTLIDSTGTGGDGIGLDASNVTVQNLSVTYTGTNGERGVRTLAGGDKCAVISVVVRDSDGSGIAFFHGTDHIVRNCVVESASASGIRTDQPRTLILGCYIGSGVTGQGGIFLNNTDDCIVSNNVVDNVGDNGIRLRSTGGNSDDNIIIGNRIISAGDMGVDLYSGSTDNIVANNRISDSTNSDIDDAGTNTALDANKTGAAN